MSAPVLVTWATRYGSTEEVAQAVAAVLREAGLTVETRPLPNVGSLENFGAVVLGCALYMSRFHREARRFLSASRASLSRKPVALFVLGPIHKEPKEWLAAQTQVEKELARWPWLHPVAQELFGGRWDPATLGFPFRLIPAMKSVPVSDVRDWEAIRAWAARLAVSLQPALPVV